MADEEPIQASINWKDFHTLMTSYRNMIEVETVVFEQLKKIIEIQQNILQKNDQTAEKQKLILEGLTQLLTTLNNMTSSYRELANKLESHTDNFAKETKSFSDKFQNYELNLVRADSRLVNKIHIAWGLMGTIAISLIGVLVTIIQRNSMVDDLMKIALQIAKKLGVIL